MYVTKCADGTELQPLEERWLFQGPVHNRAARRRAVSMLAKDIRAKAKARCDKFRAKWSKLPEPCCAQFIDELKAKAART